MSTSINSSGITFPDATTQTTAATAGVTSIVAGNGISISGSTGAVTVTNALYTPSFNQVGTYSTNIGANNTLQPGTNYTASASGISNQAGTATGTWRCMGSHVVTISCVNGYFGISIKVA